MHHFGMRFLDMTAMVKAEFIHFFFVSFPDLFESFAQYVLAIGWE
jgi:hypothetical protein